MYQFCFGGRENLKMNESTFVYWLQGFVEIANTDTISEKQWQIIKDHLKLVFDKKTPDRNLKVEDIFKLKEKPVDLIGTQRPPFAWPDPTFPPYTITCSTFPAQTAIC